MSYKDLPFEQRLETLGDEAENRFEEWCRRNRLNYVRCGLNRPPLRMGDLPTRIRYWPDYLQSSRFVECQGFGKDQLVKLKIEKHGALRWWNDLHTVHLYLWDRVHERECFVDLDVIDGLIGQVGTLKTFPEGKPYFEFPAQTVFDRAEA